MKKIKREFFNSNKRKLLLFIFFILFISSGISFGRYIYNSFRNYYFEAKKFYFNSDKLSEVGTDLQMTNWSGVGSYDITFNMNSYSNTFESSNDDILYDIVYDCSSNIICSIEGNKTSSVILGNSNNDLFSIKL